MSDGVHDVVVAGSGVAGLSAAVYAARADLDPLVLEGDEPGGQLTLTTDVENYLGFPDGVGGMELIQRGRDQAERARNHDAIEFAWNTELLALQGSTEDGVTGATLVSHPDGHPGEKYDAGADVTKSDVDVGGVFYAIGHEPNTAFLQETAVELDDSGYVQTADSGDAWATAETAVEGVFAAGDVMDRDYQQAVTAAGMGSMAALDAETWLESNAHRSETSPEPVAPEAGD